MKKILILGGGALSMEIVTAAKEMGLYTIVTDWYSLEKSPAKQIADQAEFISTTDTDALLELIRTNGIDGVLTGYTDSTLPYYWKLCQEANLPCYGTLEQFDFACDKDRFKDKCREFGISVVEEYQIARPVREFAENFKNFPVLIKPVDNSGARGIHIVPSAAEFETAYESALNASPSKTVLIERLMNHKEITVFYLIINGEIHLLGTADRHVRKIQPDTIPLPIGYTFPSEHDKLYTGSTNNKVVDMLKSLGLRNGLVFMQSFVDEGDFVFYEMGYRLTGSLEHHVYEAATGINPVKMLINFAVTSDMQETVVELPNIIPFKGKGANLTVLVGVGMIAQIEGVDNLENLEGVIASRLSYKEGDRVSKNALGTLQQVALRVLFHSHEERQLRDDVELALGSVDFIDDRGLSLKLSKSPYHA